MATKQLHISPELSLPLDAVTGTFGILATKGAGKSNAAVVMAEEMWDAGVPWVAIDPKGDWYGLRSSADGKSPGLALPVFGGRHGDVPLEPGAGAMLADLVLEQRLACVIDVSQFTKGETTRFLLAFAQRLFRQAEHEPLHLFLEEAHEYLPQQVRGDQAELVGAWQRIVKQGRFKGLGCTLISQRSSSLNKDVLELVDTLIVLRTIGPRSREAIAAWVKDQDVDPKLMASLPSLADGEAWVWSPGALNILDRIHFRRRRTFDSGATPKVGESRRPPATLADVDLAAIKDAMAETIERAKAEDPKELHRQISALRKQLNERPTEKVVETVTETVEVPVLSQEAVEALRAASGALYQTREVLDAAMKQFATPDVKRVNEVRSSSTSTPTRSAPTRPNPTRVVNERQLASPIARVDGDVKLGQGEVKILIAIAQHDSGVSPEQLSVLTSYKRSSRNTYVQRLKAAGFVVVEGGRLVATAEGLAALGDDFEPLPTGTALQEYWMGELPEGERRILGELLAEWPEPVDVDHLDESTGYKRSSRNTYLQRLRARQLVTTGSGWARASDLLFD